MLPEFSSILASIVKEYSEGDDSRIFLVKTTSDQQIIGFIIGNIQNYLPIYKIRKLGYIAELYVIPEYRKLGVGKALIEHIECQPDSEKPQ